MEDYIGAGAIAAFLGLIFVFAVIGYVLSSFFLMKIFEKAGVVGAWRAWVPGYNMMVFAKLGDVNPWVMLGALGATLLLSQVPVIGFVISIAFALVSALAAWRVGLKLQKETPWVILYVLLSIVWLGINAFDKSRWNPMVGPAPWVTNPSLQSFMTDRTVWDGVPVQPQVAAPPAAAGGYAPPAGYTPPAPPAGYVPPAPPAGYTPPAPPTGYVPPAPPVGYAPPAAPAEATPPAPPAAPASDTPPAPPTAP